MVIAVTIVHVLVCVFLVIVVLLQSGKAADLAGAFGGMGSQTAFGPRGSATVLSKATTSSAILFMITSMSLAILATRGDAGGVIGSGAARGRNRKRSRRRLRLLLHARTGPPPPHAGIAQQPVAPAPAKK